MSEGAHQVRAEEEGRAALLRNACRIAGEEVPEDLDASDLLMAFAEAGLEAQVYATEDSLEEGQIRDLKTQSDTLHERLWAHSDQLNGQSGLVDPSSWNTVLSLYDSAEGSRGSEEKLRARLEAAKALKGEVHVATHKQSGRIYTWDPEQQVYDEHGEQTLRELLAQNLDYHWTRKESREIITRVSDLTYEDKSDFNADPVVPVDGADLEVEPDEVEPIDPSPDRIITSRSAAAYDTGAECPRFDRFLEESVKSEHHRRTLQEYTGYALMHWALPYHKALFLVGPRASGKSTYLDVVQELCGSTCSIAPHDLVDSRFEKINLDGSWANVRADISSHLIRNIGLFKEITAGDPIFVEDKNKPGYMHAPTTKHFYSANRLPGANIDDEAFYRRVLICPFPETVPDEDKDPHLGETLSSELDGVLSWALEGLQRLLDQDGFTHDLPPDQTRAMWERHSSSIGQWKALRLTVTGDNADIVSKDEAYNDYAAFCQERGQSQESKGDLTKSITSDPRISDGQRTLPGDSSQSRCYIGIRLPEDRPSGGEDDSDASPATKDSSKDKPNNNAEDQRTLDVDDDIPF